MLVFWQGKIGHQRKLENIFNPTITYQKVQGKRKSGERNDVEQCNWCIARTFLLGNRNSRNQIQFSVMKSVCFCGRWKGGFIRLKLNYNKLIIKVVFSLMCECSASLSSGWGEKWRRKLPEMDRNGNWRWYKMAKDQRDKHDSLGGNWSFILHQEQSSSNFV